MALSHGLCFGSRQLTTLTPSPPSLMRRLCLPSHLLTSLEICQLALSQMRSRTFLPIASSFSKLHSTNRVVGGYRAYRPPIDEAHPRLIYSRQVESVAAYGLRLGVFLCDRTLDEAKRLSVCAPGTQGRQRHPAPPAFVLEAGGPLGIGIGDFHQSRSRLLFFFRRGDRGRLSTAWPSSTAPPALATKWPGWSPRKPAP